MDTFTIREAAERCELSYQLIRKRVDRGTLQTVKRDGVRRIPRSELERAGLWPGSQPQVSDSLELVTLRQQLAEAKAKIAELSALPAELDAEREAHERTQLALHEQRAVAMTADSRRAQAEALAAQAESEATRERERVAATVEPLTEGGLVGSVRALLALRREARDPRAPEPAAA